MNHTILGIFQDSQNAEDAIKQLESKGFNPKDISIVMKDKAEGKKLAENTGADIAGGAAAGITTGAIVGGIAGLVASFMIPGLGAFMLGGPIAAALGLTGTAAATASGAATGAVAGGLLGALMSLGLPKEEAEHYESRIREGGILVAVPATDATYEEVQQYMKNCEATDVKSISMPVNETQSKAESEDLRSNDYARHSSYAYAQPAYAFGAKGGQTSREDDDKGWHGEPKRHSEASKKGRSKTSTTGKKGGSSRRKSQKKSEGRGWHGDSKEHAKAARGEEVKK